MPLRGASHYRVRSIAVAIVVVGHVSVLALLAIRQDPEAGKAADDRMTLMFFDQLEETGPALPSAVPRRPERPPPAALAESIPALTATVPVQPTAISPGIDWYAHGADAAQRAAVEPSTRAFDFPKREPQPREKKAFGWDKTHTERVHALEGGGIGIHLSDNCELVIAPFPMAGCAFGKRKARGDLFDEMKAPVEPGDWKDR